MIRHLPGTQVDSLARRPLGGLDRATSSQQASIEKPLPEQVLLAGYVHVLMERTTSAPDVLLGTCERAKPGRGCPESEWAGPTARLPARLNWPSVPAPREVHSVSVQTWPTQPYLPPILIRTIAPTIIETRRLERRRSVASMSAPDTATSKNAPVFPAHLCLVGHDEVSATASPTTPPTRRDADSPRVAPWIGDLVRGAAGRARDALVPAGLANVADLLLSLPAADEYVPLPMLLIPSNCPLNPETLLSCTHNI